MFAASKSGQSVVAAATDPNFPYVPLLLDTTSTNGQQNNTFLDSSTNNFTITRNGTPTQGSVTPYWPNGQWSNYFNGSTDYITAPNNAAFNLGTTFTIEFWVFRTAGNPQRVLSRQDGTSPYNGYNISYGEVLGSWIFDASGTAITFSDSFINTWTHYAWVVNGTSGVVYRNGVSVGTATQTAQTPTSNTTLLIGAKDGPTNYFTGYLSNLRIVKGTAVYTAAFTPSTTPLTAITNTSLLTCQSNRFKDNSTNNFTLTTFGTPKVQAFQPFSPTASYTAAAYGGSGYFNGSSDYLTAPSNAAFAFGTGDFTTEGWFYPTSATSFRYLFSIGSDANFTLALNSGTYTPYFYAGSTIITSSISLIPNQWNHVALVRSAGTAAIYINGASGGTAAFSASVAAGIVYVGIQSAGSYYFPGYSSNIRFVKGTAVYTGAFTPPTLAPLTTAGSTSAASYSSTTNVNTNFGASNTSLLLNYTNAGIYDAAVQNNAITVGSAQASITQYQWSPTSIRLNGTSDYLDLGTNQAFVMGSGNWTVEGWVYPTSTSAGHWMYLQGNASAFAAVRIGCQSNQVFLLISTNGTTNTVSSGLVGSVPINAWTYLAVTRSGTTVTLYVNGTSVYTSTALGTSALMTGTYNLVGRIDPTNLQYFTGYVQDVRITKLARTITTPTAAFPTR